MHTQRDACCAMYSVAAGWVRWLMGSLCRRLGHHVVARGRHMGSHSGEFTGILGRSYVHTRSR